jgi:hypothetical protein
MCKKSSKNYVSKKGCLPTFCGPQKAGKHHFVYVFLIQTIEGNCIFSNSLAKLTNMVQDQQVDKHTPPSLGGGAILA